MNWSRAVSLTSAPFVRIRDADTALLSLTLAKPAALTPLANDYFAVEAFDTPAATAVAAPPMGRGRGRGDARGAVALAVAVAVPAGAPALPGPLNLTFLNLCSIAVFDSCNSFLPLQYFARLVGAIGPVCTRASRFVITCPAHI